MKCGKYPHIFHFKQKKFKNLFLKFKLLYVYAKISIMKNGTIYTTILQTPKLLMFAASFENKLILFVPFEKEFCNKKMKSFKKILKVSNIIKDDSKFDKLKLELDEYFNKQREKFTISFKLIGTPFQIKCWETLNKIPYGKTISYKEEAKNIGNEKAYRAVANANGKNNLSIIIPCHRVISNDGKIGGYTGGVWIKEYLLNLEKENYELNLTSNENF